MSLSVVGIASVVSVACSALNKSDGDAGAPVVDGGAPADSGVGAIDSGAPATDSGTSATETGAPQTDAGASDGAASGACGQGSIIEGDVAYAGSATPNPAGQGLLEDPPVSIRRLTFAGNVLHANTNEELWNIDFTKATPTIVRYAGVGGAGGFAAGACADARFPQVGGLAVAPDGSLFVTDDLANAVLRVTSPGGAGCAVSYYAGTNTPATSVTSAGLNPGDQDGPGSTAKFNGPAHPAVDEAGNVYMLDQANHVKLKKIANDAAHTVSTIVTLPFADNLGEAYPAMTYLKGKLYITHDDSGADSILEVDPVTGAQKTLVTSPVEPLASSDRPGFGSLTHNGVDLFAAGHNYVWSFTTSGAVRWVAGNGDSEFGPTYDHAIAHPAKDLTLPGRHPKIAYRNGAIYWLGDASSNTNSYIAKISCP